MSEETNVQQSTVYVGRLVRVITDAVHIAFFLCNNFVGKTTKPLVKDLIRQIIPTAYSFGKSDWVFYTISSDRSRGICACGRFCIRCRHDYLQSWHCVEVNKSLSLAPPIFGNERGDIVQPLISNFNISIDEKLSIIVDFDLSPIEYVDIKKDDEDTEVLSEQFSNIRINRTPYKIRHQKTAAPQDANPLESPREDTFLPVDDQNRPIVHQAPNLPSNRPLIPSQELFYPQLNRLGSNLDNISPAFVNRSVNIPATHQIHPSVNPQAVHPLISAQEFAHSHINPSRTLASASVIRQALISRPLISAQDCLPPLQQIQNRGPVITHRDDNPLASINRLINSTQPRPPINLQPSFPPLNASQEFLQRQRSGGGCCKCASCVATRNLRGTLNLPNIPIIEPQRPASPNHTQFFSPQINLGHFHSQHYRNYQPQLLINPEHPIGCYHNISSGHSQQLPNSHLQIPRPIHPFKLKNSSSRPIGRPPLHSRGNPKSRLKTQEIESTPNNSLNLQQYSLNALANFTGILQTPLGVAQQRPVEIYRRCPVAQPRLIAVPQVRLKSPSSLFPPSPESVRSTPPNALNLDSHVPSVGGSEIPPSANLSDRASKVLFGISKPTPTNHQSRNGDSFDLPERLKCVDDLTREQLMFIEGTSSEIPPAVQQVSIPETNPKNLSPTVPIRLEYVILPEIAKSNKTYCFFPPSGSLFLTTFHEFHAGKVDRHKISYTPQKGAPSNDTEPTPFSDKVHIISDVRYGNLSSRATNTPTDNNKPIKQPLEDCTCVYCK